MRRSCYSTAFAFIAAATLFSEGCWWGPTPLKVPKIQPQEAAEAAFSKYDTSGDGVLDKKELELAPSLQSAMRSIDRDRDKRLSLEELAGRLEQWVDEEVAASILRCYVTVKGRPLGGAEVKFIPEEFLEDVIHPATGTTSQSGKARMSMDKEHLPRDMQNLPVVQKGYYRVEITHPGMQLPSEYNTASTLGVEVSFERGKNSVAFNL